jgi:hypothetical protein
MRDGFRLAALLGLVLDGFQDIGIEHQLLDQAAPPRQLEGRDLQTQALVQLVDGAVGAPLQPPAERRPEQPVDQGNDREHAQHYGQPQRDGHR